MTTSREQDLFLGSVKKWGLASQILMLAEEASELSVACLHYLREKKKPSAHNLAEEMADVELMLDEIKHILGFEPWCRVFREQKMNRVEQYLKEDSKNEFQLQRDSTRTSP